MSDAAIRAWRRARESRSVCNGKMLQAKVHNDIKTQHNEQNTLKLVFRAEDVKRPPMWVCYFLFL